MLNILKSCIECNERKGIRCEFEDGTLMVLGEYQDRWGSEWVAGYCVAYRCNFDSHGVEFGEKKYTIIDDDEETIYRSTSAVETCEELLMLISQLGE